MNNKDVFDDLNTYLTKLNDFFSLNRNSSKKELYTSLARFIKTFDRFELDISNKMIDLLQQCYDPMKEVIDIAAEIEQIDLKIKSKTQLEKDFTDISLDYLRRISVTYCDWYLGIVGSLKGHIESSKNIKNFRKSQNRIKLFSCIGVLAIPLSLFGLLPIVSLIALILSIVLFFIDRFIISPGEIDKLKKIGAVIQKEGKISLNKMIEVFNKLQAESKFISSKKHFISNEIFVAFTKLEKGEKISDKELLAYKKELELSKKNFIKQFQ